MHTQPEKGCLSRSRPQIIFFNHFKMLCKTPLMDSLKHNDTEDQVFRRCQRSSSTMESETRAEAPIPIQSCFFTREARCSFNYARERGEKKALPRAEVCTLSRAKVDNPGFYTLCNVFTHVMLAPVCLNASRSNWCLAEKSNSF